MDLFLQSFQLMGNLWPIYSIFGLLFGSFLNVVICRIPEGTSIAYPPSSCPNCKKEIKWYDNIPVLSWLILKGKCRNCKTPISFQYPLIELATGILTTSLFFYYGKPCPQLFIIIPFSYILLAIAVIDFKTYSIPSKLQYSILTTGIIALIWNFFTPGVLPIDWLGSLIGAATGFGILYTIQFIGKIIYKQDAMGGGDLFLMGYSGILLGWKNILIAFFTASLLAVLAYMIPTIINILKKKGEVAEFLRKAEEMQKNTSLTKENNLFIKGLQLQLNYVTQHENYKKELKNYLNKIKESKQSNLLLLTSFFRLLAVKEEAEAILQLKKVDPDNKQIFSDLRDVISIDLIGYDSDIDNLNLLIKYAEKNKLHNLKKIVSNRKKILKKIKIITLNELEEKLESKKNKTEKIDLLLEYNRIYQLSGYTKEQLKVAEKIEQLTLELSFEGKNRIYAEMGYVYYIDLYTKQSEERLKKLARIIKENNNTATFEAVKTYYNLALFRAFFMKQKLAFGPYLALGILLSMLYGQTALKWYLNFVTGVIQ